MSKTVKLRKGHNLKIKGKAKKELAGEIRSNTYALKPDNFKGLERQKLLVSEGDNVKAGSPLFFDKYNEKIQYTAPVSGEIAEVRRGEKRKIIEIVILADKEVEFESFEKYAFSDIASLSEEQVKDQILKSGAWCNIIERPFAVVANPDLKPKAIHISCTDSHPLAADYAFVLQGEEEYFKAGVEALKKLTEGKVHLNTVAEFETPTVFKSVSGVNKNKFSGPHPSGNVGVQIHHIDPVNKGDVVWTLTPYGVVILGKLFLEGKYDTSKVIALAGSQVTDPKYYKVYSGVEVSALVDGNIKEGENRYVSGNVLTGEAVEKDNYLNYYDNVLTVLPEGKFSEFFGWIKPTASKMSLHRAFGLLSFLNSNKEFEVNTNMNGEERALVQTGTMEKVLPMDILPTYLIKAIMAEDYDEMEALGIYEVAEEDFALCEFIDVSKHPVQGIIREGLELMRKS